ncbi:hypothetical protein BJY04DRAFT_181632 [Aspergillus karnatakaensis]|uniref:putative C2H2 finger domain protein n=1 Tax=Aspergillus karnatakaensis TaxID=1810916 RepID=UPI003CCDD948
MFQPQTTPSVKKQDPKPLDKSDDNKVLEIVTHSLYRDGLAPGGYVLREVFDGLDRRHLPFPNWRCNECHHEFPTAALRDSHEATHWHVSKERSLGMSVMGHEAMLNRVPPASRQTVLDEFIKSPRRYKHDGLPPAPEVFRVPYEGSEEASSLNRSSAKG